MHKFFFSGILIFFLLNNGIAFSQNDQTEEHAYMMVKSVQKFHYSPKEVNDVFSETVFNRIIEFTDPIGIIFTQSDITELSEMKFVIDDDILNKEKIFLNSFSNIYTKRLSELRSWYEDMIAEEIEFTNTDSIILSEEISYSDFEEQNKIRQKFLKFKILLECMFVQDSLLSESDFSRDKISETKSTIIQNDLCRLDRKLSDRNAFDQYLNSVYLHTIAYSFDPHTDYFSADDMDAFQSILSKETATFGLSLTSDENYRIRVDKIIPGGPAWDSDLINEGDVIMKVIPENNEPMNFECIRLSEANLFLASDKINEATFFIRKKNGKELIVKLEKEILSVEDNIINSFILKGTQDLGYIRIPSFYADFEYYSVKGCADDLAKEIIRLKRKGIKGLILDLRDNGGGALTEAVKTAGLFIDFGSVGILDTRYDDITVLKDGNRGILFTEPLIVMINSSSASASEFLAAALQDYNRALIVGTTSFGKSTSQIILPIDAYNNLNGYSGEDDESEAYIKLTTGIFFRVTGKSHQRTGILPDIELAEEGYPFRESDLPTAMDTVSTEKKAWYKPLKEFPIEILRERSEARFSPDRSFHPSELNLYSGEKISIPLNVDGFVKFANSFIQIEDPKEEDRAPFCVSSFDFLKGNYTDDRSSNEMINDASDKISRDRTIFEAYNILNDLINYNKK